MSNWRGRVQKARAVFRALEEFGALHEDACGPLGGLTPRILVSQDHGTATVLMRCWKCKRTACHSLSIEIVIAARQGGEPEALKDAPVEIVSGGSDDVH